jgi:hypothetical protein
VLSPHAERKIRCELPLILRQVGKTELGTIGKFQKAVGYHLWKALI